ncbi:hypothetical protein ACUXK4_003980 [Methylorubrum extorquens]
MSEKETHWATLSLLNALDSGVFTLKFLADDLVQAALDMPDDAGVELIHGVAHQQRVRALELQGQHAALSTEYTARYHSEP